MWFGRLILMCACVSASSVAIGQVYKWVDENGKVHYGDRPSEQQPTTRIAAPKASASAGEPAHRRAQADCNSSDCGKAITNQVRTNPLASGQRSRPRATPTTGIASDSAQKAKADCKANRGVDCDNPAVVSQWARQNTPATQQDIDRAVGERNRRRIDEQFQHNLERSRDMESLRSPAR